VRLPHAPSRTPFRSSRAVDTKFSGVFRPRARRLQHRAQRAARMPHTAGRTPPDSLVSSALQGPRLVWSCFRYQAGPLTRAPSAEVRLCRPVSPTASAAPRLVAAPLSAPYSPPSSLPPLQGFSTRRRAPGPHLATLARTAARARTALSAVGSAASAAGRWTDETRAADRHDCGAGAFGYRSGLRRLRLSDWPISDRQPGIGVRL
jgi:hypothetical protein